MKLSTKGRYAISAMLDLAESYHKKPLTLADISNAQGISLSYLEQLFAKLRTSGLVEGIRGPGGGYRLSLSPANISISDILEAIDEQAGGVRHAHSNHALWNKFSERLQGHLAEMTLADFVPEVERRQIKATLSPELLIGRAHLLNRERVA